MENNKLLALTVVVALSSLLPFAARAELPTQTAHAEEWSRTMLPAPLGCAFAVSSGANQALFRHEDSSAFFVRIPAQVMITNNSTAAATYCWSQDDTLTITRTGWFSVDGDAYYNAGPGPCIVVGPGSWPFAITGETFVRSNQVASREQGSRPYRCSTAAYINYPCFDDGDCPAGVCGTNPPITAALYAIHRAGADADSQVCEVK